MNTQFHSTDERKKEINRIGNIFAVGTVLFFLGILFFNTSDRKGLFSFLIVIVFLAAYSMTTARKKYSLVDYFTLKARDEREQIIIDSAARKTYAFIRIVVLLITIAFVSTESLKIGFDAFSFVYIFLALLLLSHFLFLYFTKKIS